MLLFAYIVGTLTRSTTGDKQRDPSRARRIPPLRGLSITIPRAANNGTQDDVLKTIQIIDRNLFSLEGTGRQAA